MLLRWLGYGLCHQLPERSFFGGGLQVPVCARDTGIYAGFVIAMVLLAILEGHERPTEPPSLLRSSVLALFVVALVYDGVTSYAGLRQTTNPIRLATGLATGFALAAFTFPLLNSQVWRRWGAARVFASRWAFTVFLVSLPAAWAGVLLLAPRLGRAYPWLVAVSILLTFTCVNLVMVCLLPPFERRATVLMDLLPPVGVAGLLSIVELAGAAWLKHWLEGLAGLR